MSSTPTAKDRSFGLFFNDPDVSEHNRIAVILKKQGVHFWAFTIASGRSMSQLSIIMNQDAIVPNGHPSVGCFRSIIIITGGSEINIVGLPSEGWKTHIHIRL
jgi:hypothetical protein